MRKTLEDIGLGLAIVLLLIIALGPKGAKFLGSSTGYYSLNLTPSASTGDTYGLAVNGTQVIDMNGNVSTTNSFSTNSLTIGAGTAITKYLCATATWNPGSLSANGTSTAATSTDVALTGAVLGDNCSASLTSATTTSSQVGCGITGTATATIQLVNLSNGALDLATGTAKVCFTH